MAASKKEKPIIEIKNLSKQYNIGMDRTYKTFCDSFTSAVRHPLKTLKDCRRPNDTFWALKDVNFEVERGEVIGIIGRNGAGKSTLLKILSRITYPTEGQIRIRGRVGSLLEVGTGFHPELTGRENIYFNGAILGMKKREIDEKFDEIVKFSGVEKFLDTPVKRYSSGMQVRLAFSVAANLDPEILVIDEVLAVGDAAFQKKCLGKMGEVAEGGRTVLFVSHNMDAVKKLCTKGYLISEGQLTQMGDVDDVVAQYISSANEGLSLGDLINTPNRNKNYYPFLTNITIGGKDNVVRYGTPMTIIINYNFPKKIINPQFVIIIKNLYGITVFKLLSDWQLNNFPNSIVGSGEVRCNIQFLPLMPGEYFIDLLLWQLGEQLDGIENATKITVVGLEHLSGRQKGPKSGVVYVDASWEVR